MPMTDERVNPKKFEPTANINDHRHKVIFDTGASNSYVSSK